MAYRGLALEACVNLASKVMADKAFSPDTALILFRLGGCPT